jgi:DNA-binding transcriptional MerR regulator
MTMRVIGGGAGGSGKDGGASRPAPLRPIAPPSALRRETPREVARHVSELPPLPEKIYFRIGEVSSLVGVAQHVLRYWEQEFRSIRPTKSQSGQRVYTRRDVEHLRRIRELLYDQGFTIAGAKKALRAKGAEPHDDGDPVVVAGTRAREALVELRHQVEAFLRELGG